MDVCCTSRDQDCVGCRQRIGIQQPEGRGTVDEYVVILIPQRLQGPGQQLFLPGSLFVHLQVRTGQSQIGGENVKPVCLATYNRFLHRHALHENGVDRGLVFGEERRESLGGVALGIKVHEQHCLAGSRKARREVDGCRGFSHPAFLVGYCHHFCHVVSSSGCFLI